MNIGAMTPRQLTKLVLRLPPGVLSEHILAELRHHVQQERRKDDSIAPAIYGRRTLPWR